MGGNTKYFLENGRNYVVVVVGGGFYLFFSLDDSGKE